MPNRTDLPVAVVGAGPVGMTAAAAPVRQDVLVTVVEAALQHPRRDGPETTPGPRPQRRDRDRRRDRGRFSWLRCVSLPESVRRYGIGLPAAELHDRLTGMIEPSMP
jgi:threonine dehydrogenase-like Zn-dependent dehydrogenase